MRETNQQFEHGGASFEKFFIWSSSSKKGPNNQNFLGFRWFCLEQLTVATDEPVLEPFKNVSEILDYVTQCAIVADQTCC